MIPRAFQIHPSDNVATMIEDQTSIEPVMVLGAGGNREVRLLAPVAAGHKIALAELSPQTPVVKFGVRIGFATAAIQEGEWVHLHNCASYHDERSGTLDPETGVPTDTPYL